MNNQEKELKTRDKEAEKFEEWYLQKGFFYDLVEKKVIYDNLNLQSSDIVLDTGCGTGRLTRKIAKRCKKVYGLDFSSKSIEVLNKKIKEEKIENIETQVCDITESLPVKEKVDKILSVQVIQHIPTQDGRYKALKNLYEQLRPNGICVATFYNWRVFSNKGLLKEGEFPGGIYYFRFTPKEAYELFRSCGFRDISVRGCVNFRDYAYLEKRKAKKLAYPIAKFDIFLSKFGLSCLFGDFLICKGVK